MQDDRDRGGALTIDGLETNHAGTGGRTGRRPNTAAPCIDPRDAYDAVVASTTGALILDVRTNAEWCLVGVPKVDGILFLELADADGAPNETFAEELGYWVHREVPLYVLSRSGSDRSRAAVDAAGAAGFTDVAVIDGGFEGPLGGDGQRGHSGWKAAGLPWRQW